MPKNIIAIKQNLTLDKIIKKLKNNYYLPTDFRIFFKEYLSKEISLNIIHNYESKYIAHTMNLWIGDIDSLSDLHLINLWKRFWTDQSDYFFCKLIRKFLKTPDIQALHSENISQLSPPSKSI